jgi:DUF971 family protein/molybdopterin converting factor small subunit
MADSTAHPQPTGIQLHSKSRILSVAFEDGQEFHLPCEYLRVFSPAAEVKGTNALVVGKEKVNISRIEPQGQYAVRLIFDDGHDTGIYSWGTLYQLGAKQQENWNRYLERCQSQGYQRQEKADQRRINVLYFAYLAQKMRKDGETLDLPPAVSTVQDLLRYLGVRRMGAAPLFAPERINITVNKQFAELFTLLEDGDEVGIVPNGQTPPATPDLV